MTSFSVFAKVRMPVSLALAILIAAIAPGQNAAKSKSASVNRNFAGSQLQDSSQKREGLDSPRGGTPAQIPMDSNPLFLPPVGYASGGAQVSSLAVADLNGDGKLDVVAATPGSGALTMWLGNGDGTFQAATTIPGFFSSPYSVAVGDLNGDGIPDLAVALSTTQGGGGQGTVSILLGNGDGTFQSFGNEIITLAPAFAIQIADVNRDGKPDLVLAEWNSGEVFFGNGDGTFRSNGGVGIFDGAAYSVTVADVNKDGWPDILFGNNSVGGVELNLNNGDGTFSFAKYIDAGFGELVWSIAVADVNGDGNPDLITANQCIAKHCDQGVSVILGNGDGTFLPAVQYHTGDDAGTSVALADVNGDGHLDILYSHPNAQSPLGLAVLLGNGDGTFQQAQFYQGGYVGVAADVNGDGRPDVVAGSAGEGMAVGMEVIINNTGPHQPSTTALASDAAPAAPNQLVTYTATVTSQYAGSVTGSVTFTDRGKPIGSAPVSSNTASIALSYPKSGKHLIVATYSGDYYTSVSTSPTFAQYIENLPVASATHVTTSGSPSHVGQPVTFTAVVTSTFGSIPNGELVTFSDGNTVLGTAPIASGSATFTTSSLTVKKHTINANYGGDAAFKPSHGHVVQVVQP